MYNMEIKQAEKIFLINVSGFVKMDEALNFIKDLKSHIARIPNKSDYHFVINAKEQKTVASDVQAVLVEALNIYTNTPFKSHHAVELESAISNMQIQRAGSTGRAEKFQTHSTLQQALSSCK